ncbi:MAG: hypothetical protein KGL44_07405 [Sphingomonadales bacterium]|nr:hypothetical protein [Sphingomonadales bacterium]
MIASLGPEIPHELLAATGQYTGPLGWRIDRDFPRAAQWLESKFPLWALSIVEDWADGAMDHLETVVFSRADDSAQRLYYYLCELQARGLVAGPRPLILDIARIGRASSEARCIEAVRQLAGELGVGDAALVAAIGAANAAAPQAANQGEGAVCLLAGTHPPDRRLHATVEAAGWQAAGETLGEVWSRSDAAVEDYASDPCAALGRRLHGAATGTRGFQDRGAEIVARARAAGAAAVVLWYSEEDEAEVWHLPAQKRALADAGLPTLVLTRRDWRCNDGVVSEIVGFLTEQGA